MKPGFFTKPSYRCDSCTFVGKNRKHLANHVALNHSTRVYRCSPCAFVTRYKANFYRHRRSIHKLNSANVCESSPSVSSKKGQTGRRTYTCAECNLVTKWPREFLNHRRDIHGDRISIHECPFCEYASEWLQNVRRHANVIHKNEMNHSHLMSQHQKIHRTPDGKVPDGVPDSGGIQTTTAMVNGTARHMFKCRFCPLTNKRRANVKIHERMHTASKGAKFQCLLCSYRCNNRGVLARHMKLHKADNPSLDLKRMKTFCENLNTLPPRPAVAKKSAPEAAATAAQRSEFTALKDKLKPPSRKKIFSYFCDKCPAMFKSHTDLDTHRTYHNSAYLYPCHLCDYRARHKPHLHKHLLVHKPEYAERQNGFTLAEIRSQDRSQQAEPESPPTVPFAADQMLLLEKAETRAFVDAGTQSSGVQLHRCTLCPAAFQKATTLEYHVGLHGSAGVYACHFCTYAANSAANVSAHTHLHYQGAKQPLKMFRCNKCPASFSKYNRFESHLTLHGRNERFRCSHCDYSVKFAANLVKHRKLHEVLVPESEQPKVEAPAPAAAVTSTPQPSESTIEPSSATPVPDSAASTPAPALVEEKRVYICSRCPYAFHCRETVVNHLQRHGTSEGFCCTFCDYRSLHMSTLRDHTRCHFQPMRHYKPQAYMKCDSLEIWGTTSDGTRTLLFRDDGDGKFSPKLDECEGAAEDDASPSSPTSSTPSGSGSASTASSCPDLHLSSKDEPHLSSPVEQEADDVVLASKEALEDLVSNVVVLNDAKEDVPPGCKTQVVNIVVLDGSKQLNEIEEGVAHAEPKSESDIDCKEEGESAQDLFNRICNPGVTDYEDIEDEKDVYCEVLDWYLGIAVEVECQTMEEDSVEQDALVTDKPSPRHCDEHSEFMDVNEPAESETSADCKDALLCSKDTNGEPVTDAPVYMDSLGEGESMKEVLKADLACDTVAPNQVKKFERSTPGGSFSAGLKGCSAETPANKSMCIGLSKAVVSNVPPDFQLKECAVEITRHDLEPGKCCPLKSERIIGESSVENTCSPLLDVGVSSVLLPLMKFLAPPKGITALKVTRVQVKCCVVWLV